MNEIAKFEYDQLDDSTATFLRKKESNMREIVGKAYTELGRELNEAQDELARRGSKYEGVFEKWYTSMGFKKTSVYNYINRYNLVQQLNEVDNGIDVEELPNNLTYEIAKPSADSTQAKTQAKAEVLAGDITKLKQYKDRIAELEAKTEKAEQRAELERKERERLEELAEEYANKKPEVRTEYIEVQKESPELRDRSFDTPYGVKLLGDFHNAMDELSEWQRKYAWISSDIEQLRVLAEADEDMREEFEKNRNMWRTLSEIFDGGSNSGIIDAEIIEINQ